jgi:outer membrane protein assembly factor BamB
MLWSSPVFYKGNVYIGSASYGDCPLTPGELFEINGATGAILHTFTTVPPGCIGGGIWSTPTIDTATGELYTTTGTIHNCNPPEIYAVGILELHAADLSLVGSWQVPVADRAPDGDFGTTPTLFQAKVGTTTQYYVGAANKNGKYYAFIRGQISSGPTWTAQIAITGSCPQCGEGTISSSAFDGTRLYVAGGNTTTNGTSCPGSMRALNPVTGKIMWETCLSDGPVLGAVITVPGVAVVGAGKSVVAFDTSSGQILTRLTDSSNPSRFYGPASISNGVIYIGNMDWNLFAYGL